MLLLLLLTPCPFLGTPAHFPHRQCNNQTLDLQGRGPRGAWCLQTLPREHAWRETVSQGTHLHQRQLLMPGCQWLRQRSCRCQPLQCPSSPPPRCTGARCKAPWSAHAWFTKHSHKQTFRGNPMVASTALQTPGQGQDGWEGEGW